MSKRTGFTMIELLVVIAIISILIAIAQPILTGSASRTYEYQCESHLHQVGVAMQAYAQDNGAFPQKLGQLDNLLQDRNLLQCPKISSDYYYLRPAPNSGRDTVIAACVNPSTPIGHLPHRYGNGYLTLTVNGGIKRVVR